MEKIKNGFKKIKSGFKKFINVIKKKWLISGTKTALLIAIFIAVFIAITVSLQNLDLTPIDLTADKTYTLSDESKEKVSEIDKDVNLYFIGYDDDDSALILAKQYNKTNEKINVETIDITQRTDLAQKYGLTSSDEGIIVESGDNSNVISSSDLYSYDSTSGGYQDLTESKLTSSIIKVTTDDIPNVYFLSGYSNFKLSSNMNYLSAYLENEIMNIEELDLLTKQKVPDDCDALVITTPSKDFADTVAKAIINYINAGGNVLWFNSAQGEKKDLPNVNKVLAVYGVEPFEVGYVQETDSDKTISGASYMIKPTVEYTDITSDIYSSDGAMLLEATKINLKSDEDLEKLKVEEEDLLTTTDTAYFRSDLTITTDSATDKDTKGEFVLGTMLTKTIKDAEETTNDETGETEVKTPAVESKLIIFGENYFISDYPISNSSQTPCIAVYDNKDIALNSLAYLTERDSDITVRKTTEDVTYTATETEDTVIKVIIFTVPVLILGAGIVVWQVRRRKK